MSSFVDVAKCVMLSTILEKESPDASFHAPAGSATITPGSIDDETSRRGREYGSDYFRQNVSRSEVLSRSKYVELMSEPDDPQPAAVALRAFDGSHIFMDPRESNLHNIESYAEYHRCGAIMSRKGCSLTTMLAGCFWRDDLEGMLVVVDPPDPSAENADGDDWFNLVEPLLKRNATIVFCFGENGSSSISWDGFALECRQKVIEFDHLRSTANLDRCFEVNFKAPSYPLFKRHEHSFVKEQHGFICFGMKPETIEAIRTVGQELELLYQDFKFSNDDHGMPRFEISPLSKRTPCKPRRGRRSALAV